MRPPDLLTMSAIELDRLTVIERVRERRLSPRHISRLVNAFERDGPAALVSKRRGRRSNHSCADAVKTRVLSLVREHYADFGPTLIAEKLAEKHELDLSRETLRLWLMEAGLWQSRKQPRRHRPDAANADWRSNASAMPTRPSVDLPAKGLSPAAPRATRGVVIVAHGAAVRQ